MAARVMKNDTVEVSVGRDAAASDNHRVRGRVLYVFPQKGRVLVEGVNRVYRHVRPSRRNPQGGRLQKEAPIALSNVMPVCPKCDRGVRVSFRSKNDGDKERICSRCQTVISTSTRAKTRKEP